MENLNMKNIILNHVSIKEYQIVYPRRGTLFEKQVALHVASRLQDLIGESLPILSDEVPCSDKNEILIGKTNRTEAASLYGSVEDKMNGVIAGSGKFIALYGATAYGIAMAATAFTNQVRSATATDEATVDLTFSNEVIEKTDKIAAMTYNVYTGDVTHRRVYRLFEMIFRYMPNVIGVQEANFVWMAALKYYLSEYYDMVGEGRGDKVNGGESCAILFAKDRFELIDSGTKWLSETPDLISKLPDSAHLRIMTYALLKDRISGLTTLYVNTHLDYTPIQDEQTKIMIRLVQELGYEKYPLVLTGDMNARIERPAMKRMMAAGLRSSNDLADVNEGDPSIDFIMVTDDCIRVSFARLCGEFIGDSMPSDHRPNYAEFTVFTPENGIQHDYSGGILFTES